MTITGVVGFKQWFSFIAIYWPHTTPGVPQFVIYSYSDHLSQYLSASTKVSGIHKNSCYFVSSYSLLASQLHENVNVHEYL